MHTCVRGARAERASVRACVRVLGARGNLGEVEEVGEECLELVLLHKTVVALQMEQGRRVRAAITKPTRTSRLVERRAAVQMTADTERRAGVCMRPESSCGQ